MKLALIIIISFLASPCYSGASPEIPRCKTITGHPGLCVSSQFCRVRTINLGRCTTQEPVLYCCPLPTNKTSDWSLEERESVPIVFPNDPTTTTRISYGEADDYESGEIVFPVDETISTERIHSAHHTKSQRGRTTTRPTRRSTTTIRTFLKKPSRPRDFKPNILNTAGEGEPSGSSYNSDEFDYEDRIQFETIPTPKAPAPKVPTQRNNEFPNSFTTLRTTFLTEKPFTPDIGYKEVDRDNSWTQNPVTPYTGYKEVDRDNSWTRKPVTPSYTGYKEVDRAEKELNTISTSTVLSSNKVTNIPLNSFPSKKGPVTACGRGAYTRFIAGGTESSPKKWPWMVAIFQRLTTTSAIKFVCGGSLVTRRYILTAAHCCVSGASSVPLPASSFLVRMGSNNVQEGDSYSISKIKVHSNFSFSGQFNDIALLGLATDLTAYTDRIAPVCLPFPTLQDVDLVDYKATAVGWGATYLGGQHQKTLQEVSIPIVSMEDCALAYSRIKSAAFLARGSTHVLCAGLKEGGKDACKSDSGGPLMMSLNNDSWTIIGIVSFGYRCAEPGFPGVYTRVTNYLEWIYSNTQD